MFSKLRFAKPKIFVSMRVFGEIHLTQIFWNFKISSCNLTIKVHGAKVCVGFSVIPIERNLWGFKVKESLIYIGQKYKLKQKRDGMENRKFNHIFKETNLVLQLIWESRIKSKTVMSSWKKKDYIFVTFILSEGDFFKHLCFISMYSVLNKVSELLHTKKHYFIHFFPCI